MPDGFTWSEMRGRENYRLPGPDHIGWWAVVALLASLLLHVAVFFALDRMGISLRADSAPDLVTEQMRVTRVETQPDDKPLRPLDPEETIVPAATTDKLLDEIDVLEKLPDEMEIDIRPDIKEMELAVEMKAPALEGEPAEIATDLASGMEMDDELPELGSQPEQFRPAEIGQITVDPGAVDVQDDALGRMAEDLIKKGAGGNTREGALDGVVTLDDMLALPPNVLQGKKTVLPSDLLFEFNSADVLESAKVGLMKLALLIDRNPGMYCWIEGHTDLVGGDEFNLDLSRRRAEAVKSYLVESFRMDPSRIITRGFGRYQPIVTSGDVKTQGVNRRVEIRMRKTPPQGEDLDVEPKKATVVGEPTVAPAPDVAPPRQPVLVKPKRALPVDEVELAPRAQPAAPKAQAIPEDEEAPPLREAPEFAPVPQAAPPAVPQARPPAVPQARPPALRALPVEE